jgi:hypothetical protein
MKFTSSTQIESIAAGNPSGSTGNKLYLVQRLNCGMLTLKNGDLLGYLKKETGMVVDARTTIAWIRTGLALMGFGFAVASFDLFFARDRTDSPKPRIRIDESLALGRNRPPADRGIGQHHGNGSSLWSY